MDNQPTANTENIIPNPTPSEQSQNESIPVDKSAILTPEECETLCLAKVNEALREYSCQLIPSVTLSPATRSFKVDILHNSKIS